MKVVIDAAAWHVLPREDQFVIEQYLHDNGQILFSTYELRIDTEKHTADIVGEKHVLRDLPTTPALEAVLDVEWIWSVRFHKRLSWRHDLHPHHHHKPKEVHYIMSSIQVHDDQGPFVAHLVLEDAAGNPTTPDDIPQWASSAETVAHVSSMTPDGLSATITVAAIGVAQIMATTVDHNGTKVVLEGIVNVIAGEAVKGDIVFDLGGAGSVPSPGPASSAPAAAVDVPAPAPDPVAATADPAAATPTNADAPATA